ncbi:MAG: hydrogenase maturation nickel metallochaperone HypA [Deltaproteobacteria bacterium]|nr:hydrogenase maturation nickel metallochaperone HypA [Deltaproteobacteria bacterium]
MHEMSLAVSMIEQLEEIIKKEGAEKIESIHLEIGALSGVEKDAFEFVFPFAAEGTVASEAILTFDKVSLEFECRKCGFVHITESPEMMCPKCSSVDLNVLKGEDFKIKTMEVI